MGKILLFNVNIMKTGLISSLCQKLKHELILVPESDYYKTIGELAGLKIASQKPHYFNKLPDEMMVFVGFDNISFDNFLKEYKNANIPPISHKAVMTATNANWNVVTLFDDLDEHVKKQK